MGGGNQDATTKEEEPEETTGSGHEDKRAAAVVRLDQIARKFASYEDFLDSQVTEMDMFYLEDRSIARTIKELGFHGNSEKITREQFNDKKTELAAIKKIEEFKSGAKYLYTDRDVFLLELARREDANLSGRLVTVIYIRDRNAKGQEISSYIDYAQRLHEDDFASIFSGRERLQSKVTDLSHYNWDTNQTHSNNSPNFDIIFHGHGGIQLKCKKDRRIIHLDPTRQVPDMNVEDTSRTLIRSRNYAQVVLFDHFIRFWANEDETPQSKESLPMGPTGPDKDQSADPGDIELFDNVTAAIYEDDLLDIARNALGVGDLHQEHDGEWAPADVMANDEKYRGSTARDNLLTTESNSLEASVLGTMKDLYDAHKNDVSFGTLGNFTFIQMIEQLGRLLPEKARGKVDKEAAIIGEGTANVVVKIPEEDLPPVTIDADELVETLEKMPWTSDDPSPLMRDPAGSRGLLPSSAAESQDDPLNTLISTPNRHKGLEAPAEELFLGTAKTDVKTLFDPAPHMDTIRKLIPPPEKLAAGSQMGAPGPALAKQQSLDELQLKDSRAGRRDGKSITEKKRKTTAPSEKLGGAKDHAEYFKQLEMRMDQIFHGVPKGERNQLPEYPKTITVAPANGETAPGGKQTSLVDR